METFLFEQLKIKMHCFSKEEKQFVTFHIFVLLTSDDLPFLADGKQMSVEQRYITRSPNCLFCNLCPSRGETVESGPSPGLVKFTFP